MVLIPGQGGDNLLRRPLFEFLHEANHGFGGLGSDQQVKVIGHQHPADQQESGFLAELAQRLDENPAGALTRKQPTAAIGAGGDELQLARLQMASIDRHTRNIGGFGQSRESQSCARSAPACGFGAYDFGTSNDAAALLLEDAGISFSLPKCAWGKGPSSPELTPSVYKPFGPSFFFGF
jgi:hypothetical protein